VEAASQLARLSPFDPVPLGYSGDMKRRLEDNAGAKADFERAMKLDPNYTFAGYSLFDLQMEDGEISAAEETIKFLRQHIDFDPLVAREIRLHCHFNRWEEAEKAFEKLCVSAAEEDWALRTALHYFEQTGQVKRVETILARHLKDQDANKNVGAVWVTLRMAKKRWLLPGTLDKRISPSETHRRAIVCYVETIADKFSEAVGKNQRVYSRVYRLLLNRALKKHGELLRKDDWAWGKVGYALTTVKNFKAVIRWLSDWQQRKGIEAWMIYNLAVALRARGRDKEAAEVSRHGLTLEFDHNMHQMFHCWLAFHEALEGNSEGAKQHLGSIDQVKELSTYHQWLEAFARAMIEVQTAEPGNRRAAFAEARKIIKGIENGEVLGGESIARRAYWQTIKRIKTDCSSPIPLFWGFIHEYKWLSISMPIVLISLPLSFVRPELGLPFMPAVVFSLLYYAKKTGAMR
ncbi:MAG: hypothetical protein ACK4UN_08815, partial [Limisphaerales bacterium]